MSPSLLYRVCNCGCAGLSQPQEVVQVVALVCCPHNELCSSLINAREHVKSTQVPKTPQG
ncbi:hypothetical protein BKA93DRAFT_775160 [Sparassis latifolia]